MSAHPPRVYKFDDFSLDIDSRALYHSGTLITGCGNKALQILIILLKNANHLVAHQEILDEVWGEGAFGVSSDSVNHYISKIRKVLARFESDSHYIESAKGRGYMFSGVVELLTADTGMSPVDSPATITQDTDTLISQNSRWYSKRRRRFIQAALVAGLAILAMAAVGIWASFRETDEEDIRRIVKESQMYESLALYRDPSSFTEKKLDKYWLTDSDASVNYDRRRIRASIKKLRDEGQHYGDETKCERFEFQSISIDAARDFADVKTLEKWFIAVYQADGSLLKNKYVGPYFVSYNLRKVNGHWLIEKSTTARIIRPTPRLETVAATTKVVSGKQFLARITGLDMEPEFIYIEVIGPDCPERDPCKVSNSTLRETASLTDLELNNVPFNLASGTYRIFVHNGDSPASNPVNLTVP